MTEKASRRIKRNKYNAAKGGISLALISYNVILVFCLVYFCLQLIPLQTEIPAISEQEEKQVFAEPKFYDGVHTAPESSRGKIEKKDGCFYFDLRNEKKIYSI